MVTLFNKRHRHRWQGA